jgi:hypothetical protein
VRSGEPVTAETRFAAGSLTKSMVATGHRPPGPRLAGRRWTTAWRGMFRSCVTPTGPRGRPCAISWQPLRPSAASGSGVRIWPPPDADDGALGAARRGCQCHNATSTGVLVVLQRRVVPAGAGDREHHGSDLGGGDATAPVRACSHDIDRPSRPLPT